ncbi:deoxyguanosinetriphosphate triphosphohydrolase family protein [Actinoallomurus liliacearum]
MTRYTEQDTARWAPEPPKRRERTPFERDRARVLHSAALRRLAAKTQVVEPAAGDQRGQHSPRTRLTHSLECAQIGRELGKAFGCDPDLVEVACLSHDLGHPPFGHNGETALDEVAAACGGFEGNAQSLRLLTRLEAKSFAPDGRSVGLNLTRAALDAAMKYPWPRRTPVGDGAKYGVYEDDRRVFAWLRDGAPGSEPDAASEDGEGPESAGESDAASGVGAEGRGARGAGEERERPSDTRPAGGARLCFEAQVMDWADDVAYSVHDLEDGLHAGHIRLERLADPAERRAVCELTARLYCEAGVAELEERFTELLAEPYWPRAYDGTLRAAAALKNLTSELIGRFCRATERATHEAYGTGPLTRYAADLVVPRGRRLECALLKGVAARYVMGRADHGALQARQRELIAELADAVARQAPRVLDPVFRGFYAEAADDRARLRVVVDQLASLTDTSALAWHRELLG